MATREPRGRGRRIRCLFAGLAAVGVLACDPGDEVLEEATAAAAAELEPQLELLNALGYVDWDPNADESLRGVVHWDRAAATPGYHLYTNDVDEVYLDDLAGRRVHTWRLPGMQSCEHAEWLPGGALAVVCVGEALVVLEWDGTERWRREAFVHHDVTRLPGGGFLVLERDPLRTYRGRRVHFDSVVELSASGETVARWSSWDALDELQALHPASELDEWPPLRTLASTLLRYLRTGKVGTYDYYHANAVEVLPDTALGRRDPRFRAGNLLVSLRNVDTVVVLDRDDRSVQWHWGAGELEMQHMPTFVEPDRMLVFDNGTRRRTTRVVEVELGTGRIVWEYAGPAGEPFYSPWRGSNQRLASGNTLICNSESGQVLEVERSGRVVWEFWSPDLVDGARRRIYRFIRIPAAEVEPFLGTDRAAAG